jgi:competence protein ComEC
MTGRGICYSGYLDSLSWILVPAQKCRNPVILSLKLRQHMMELLSRDRPPGFSQEGAILASLLLGYRDGIGEDLQQQFTRSGAMHILAISGLHVGILYLIPAVLIGKIRRPFSLKVSASVFSLLLLWSYALLTGLSPSVIRAAGMCSIYGVAKLSGRRTGLLHLLSMAAFIMVIIRPSMIFEAGFQLSFSAVTGIALFYQRLKSLFNFSYLLPRWCWKMTSLSLSAQAGTAPLVIYHFHEYPAYSLLSNLLVIPLATMILYSGILFFSLSWVPVLSGFLSMLLHCLCRMLNAVTEYISRLPGASFGDLSLCVIQVLILYFLMLFLALYLRRRHVRFLMAIILSAAIFFAVSCCMKIRGFNGP